MNRLDFKLKKGGTYITFKSETALTNIFYAKKIVDATTIFMCMLFHEHHK